MKTFRNHVLHSEYLFHDIASGYNDSPTSKLSVAPPGIAESKKDLIAKRYGDDQNNIT